MSVPDYRRSRFDVADEDPMGPLANLADIMLVFAVGLMVALAAAQQHWTGEHASEGGMDVTTGRELPEVPEGTGEAGSGYQMMGRVYRDPETGRMILIDNGEG